MQKSLHFTITPQEQGGRLDAALASRGVEGLSRSRIKALIQEGNLTRLGEAIRDPSHKVKTDEVYALTLPAPVKTEIVAASIPFGILYEDEHLLVIDKPAGLTVHPAAGNYDRTLVNALMAHCGDTLSGIGGELRPGIVHRLDKDTSGLMVVAKHDAAHQALAAQLADRSLSRVYKALVWGRLNPASGSVETAIGRSPAHRKKMTVLKAGGKPALTYYETALCFYTHPTARQAASPVVSLVTCKLATGRTHQIRVHMTYLGHALVGDATYGGRAAPRLGRYSEEQLPAEACDALLHFPRQALHAAEIGFIHPIDKKPMRFTCNFPADFNELIIKCKTRLVAH